MSTVFDGTHECPAEACNSRVPYDQLACRKHWYKVSRKTRGLVNRTWKAEMFDEHADAMAQAVREMNA